MSLEYAPKGLLGVLTPQANTTVEPEMAVMTPPGFAVLNARLRSTKPTIAQRLADYFDRYEEALGEFANAPLAAIGYACTGASYLAGPSREDALIARLEERSGASVTTAASAVVDALRALNAHRVALVSPYDGPLDEASAGYWSARGFFVAARISAYRETDAFHPIYSLGSEAARAGLVRVAGVDVDAVVMLGTGMPTLRPIAQTPYQDDAPVLSCMLCLGWRLVCGAQGHLPDRGSLLAFLDDKGWRARLASSTLGD